MRALILPDRPFLGRERSLLTRLEVGLADDGMRVLHAVPASAGNIESLGVYSTSVTYQDRAVPLTLGLRAGTLLDLIDDTSPAEPGRPLLDLIHAFGPGSWAIASSIARRLGTPLVVELYNAEHLAPLAALARKIARAVSGDPGRLSGYGLHIISADPALAEIAHQAVANGTLPPSTPIYSATWGVHVPEVAHTPPPLASNNAAPRALAVAMLANPGLTRATRAAATRAVETAIVAVADLVSRGLDLVIFCDAELASRVPVFRAAGRAGISNRLNIIDDLEGQREMLLTSDVLLLATASGEQRTVVLDAMASGTLVLAQPDAANSTLIDRVTCRLCDARSPQAWIDTAAPLLADPAQVAALIASARNYVNTSRLASSHVVQLLAAYSAISQRASAGAISGGVRQ